jgi:hypothetical protein
MNRPIKCQSIADRGIISHVLSLDAPIGSCIRALKKTNILWMKCEAMNSAKRAAGKGSHRNRKGSHRTSRPILASLALVLITVMNVQAQGFHLGVKAGANMFKIDGQSFDQSFQFGYNIGAFAELNFTSQWGIQPELMWNQTNYRTGENFNAIFPGSASDLKGKLNYLSIPILLSFRPIKLISLQAGPQFGILMSGDQNLGQNGQNAFKKGDFSLVGGAQLNLAGFKLGARYVIGLSNVNDLGNGTATNPETWKNQGFQVYAGFRIF